MKTRCYHLLNVVVWGSLKIIIHKSMLENSAGTDRGVSESLNVVDFSIHAKYKFGHICCKSWNFLQDYDNKIMKEDNSVRD